MVDVPPSAPAGPGVDEPETEIIDEKVTPAQQVTGSAPSKPRRAGPAFSVVAESTVYLFIAVLAVGAIYINYGLANGWYGEAVLSRFNADANLVLAAAAVLAIAFEIRKERSGK
jgi:hypothetical protein